jgi:hypothetical protein
MMVQREEGSRTRLADLKIGHYTNKPKNRPEGRPLHEKEKSRRARGLALAFAAAGKLAVRYRS